MTFVIDREGWSHTKRGWRPGTDEATRYPTQGEAQEAIDEMRQTGLAQLGGTIQVKDLGHE